MPALWVRLPGFFKLFWSTPSDGTTHWSSYRLAKHLGVSPASVYRSGDNTAFNPIGCDATWPSNDPEFEEKATDIIGLF